MASILRRTAFRACLARPFSTVSPSFSPSSIRLLSSDATRITQRTLTVIRNQRLYSDQAKIDEAKDGEARSASDPLVEASGAVESSGAAETSQQAANIDTEIQATKGEGSQAEAAEIASADPTEAAEVSAASAAATTTSSQRPHSANWQAGPSAIDSQTAPFGRITPHSTLYVGNMFFEATEQELQQHFEEYGSIESIKIIRDQKGLSKGFGYITYSDVDSATRAIQARNQDVFLGRRLTVQYHRPRLSTLTQTREPNKPSKTLFIGNMSFDMSDKDLNELFADIKNVRDVRVAIDRQSGQPRGFAHADFVDEPSATKALEVLKDKEIYGRRLRVDYSTSHGGGRNRAESS